MTARLLGSTGAALALAALLSASAAGAGEKVRCPVCGQVFDEGVPVCPNDGTDLAAEGRPVAGPAAGEGEGEEAGGEGEDGGGQAPQKYRRQDVGGDRRRADAGGEAGYDDRRARLGGDRRGDGEAERRRQLKERRARAFADEDRRRREEFERRRGGMWERRRERAAEDRRAAEGLEELGRRSLWGRGAPLTSIGVRIAWMGEGADPGPVTSAEIDVNLSKAAVRAGLSSSIGVRSLSHRADLLFLESVSFGVQLPWRFSPYAVARGGIGVLATNRFGEDLDYLVRSVGADVGIDCRLTRWFVVTPALGYAALAIDDAYWHTFTARLSVGF